MPVRSGGTLGDISQVERADPETLPGGAPSAKVARNYQAVEAVLRANPGMSQKDACARAGVATSTYDYAKKKMECSSGYSCGGGVKRDMIRPGDAILKAEQRRASAEEDTRRFAQAAAAFQPRWTEPTPAEVAEPAADVDQVEDEASPGDPVDALTNCVRWIETIREPLRRRQIARALAAYFDEVA